jgi:hypothetical protein
MSKDYILAKKYADNQIGEITPIIQSVNTQLDAITQVPAGGSTGQILVKTASGHEWQSPGTASVTDGSITPEKTDFFAATRINYIDEAALLHGFINGGTGNYAANETYRCTPPIPVQYGEIWSTNSVSATKVALYNASNVFIKLVANNINFTIDDETAAFMRVSFLTATANKMLNRGATVLTYVPYAERTLDILHDYFKTSLINNLLGATVAQTI